jgi:hypothetical protein
MNLEGCEIERSCPITRRCPGIEKEHEEPPERLCRGQDWKWLRIESKSKALPREPTIFITWERITGNPSETRTGYFWIQIYNVTIIITCLFLTLCVAGLHTGVLSWRWTKPEDSYGYRVERYRKQRPRPIVYCIQYCPRRNREKQASTTLHNNETDFSGNLFICNEVVWKITLKR